VFGRGTTRQGTTRQWDHWADDVAVVVVEASSAGAIEASGSMTTVRVEVDVRPALSVAM
jgi:hypothetical protein